MKRTTLRTITAAALGIALVATTLEARGDATPLTPAQRAATQQRLRSSQDLVLRALTTARRADTRDRRMAALSAAVDGLGRIARDEAQLSAQGTRHDAVRASAYDLEVLARIIKGEAHPNSSFDSKVAVGAVVLNRVRDSRFPNTIPGVVHQAWQFSAYNADNRARLYDGAIPEWALNAARAALMGTDPTDGATHYFNPFLVNPDWARNLEFVRRIGSTRLDAHDFYRFKTESPSGVEPTIDEDREDDGFAQRLAGLRSDIETDGEPDDGGVDDLDDDSCDECGEAPCSCDGDADAGGETETETDDDAAPGAEPRDAPSAAETIANAPGRPAETLAAATAVTEALVEALLDPSLSATDRAILREQLNEVNKIKLDAERRTQAAEAAAVEQEAARRRIEAAREELARQPRDRRGGGGGGFFGGSVPTAPSAGTTFPTQSPTIPSGQGPFPSRDRFDDRGNLARGPGGGGTFDPRTGQTDPRFGQGQQDPRFGQQDPRFGNPGQIDPRDPRNDPRVDPRLDPRDPRFDPRDPRNDPRFNPGLDRNDPRFDPRDPRNQGGLGGQDGTDPLARAAGMFTEALLDKLLGNDEDGGKDGSGLPGADGGFGNVPGGTGAPGLPGAGQPGADGKLPGDANPGLGGGNLPGAGGNGGSSIPGFSGPGGNGTDQQQPAVEEIDPETLACLCDLARARSPRTPPSVTHGFSDEPATVTGRLVALEAGKNLPDTRNLETLDALAARIVAVDATMACKDVAAEIKRVLDLDVPIQAPSHHEEGCKTKLEDAAKDGGEGAEGDDADAATAATTDLELWLVTDDGTRLRVHVPDGVPDQLEKRVGDRATVRGRVRLPEVPERLRVGRVGEIIVDMVLTVQECEPDEHEGR